MVMPGLNGLQVVDQVCLRRPGIGILLTSGYSSAMVGDHNLLKTDTVFLQKPYTITELLERVREALSQSAKRAVATKANGESWSNDVS